MRCHSATATISRGLGAEGKHIGSDDEVPLFPKGWAPKEKRDSDDDVPLFPEGCKRKAKLMRRNSFYFAIFSEIVPCVTAGIMRIY